MLATTSESPRMRAAAPSPRFCSNVDWGAPRRQSAAVTSTLLAEPALTVSIADLMAAVPALRELA